VGGILKIWQTQISGLVVVEAMPYVDSRGVFTRVFCNRELSVVIGSRQITQISISRTVKIGAVRGMHFQKAPNAEMKLVRCVKGRVFDVAVDLRTNSPTFLKWHAQEISKSNSLMMVIPEGFAHGFQALEPDSELLYLNTEYYKPELEGGLRYDDPSLDIMWPLPISDLSNRDSNHKLIDSNFKGL